MGFILESQHIQQVLETLTRSPAQSFGNLVKIYVLLSGLFGDFEIF